MAKGKRTKEQTTIYKALHRKLSIEENETHKKPEVNSGVQKGWGAFPTPHVAPIMTLCPGLTERLSLK